MSNVTNIQQGTAGATGVVESKVRRFIIDNFLFSTGGDGLDSDSSFLESGIIDSTGILEIVHYLEEEFGFQVEDEELVPDNLDSVSRITAFIRRKTAA